MAAAAKPDVYREIARLRFGALADISGSGSLAVRLCGRIQLELTPMLARATRLEKCGPQCSGVEFHCTERLVPQYKAPAPVIREWD